MIEAPCKDCERKGCGAYHSKCEPYNQYVKEREANKEKLRKFNEVEGQYHKFRSEMIRKTMRNRRKGI